MVVISNIRLWLLPNINIKSLVTQWLLHWSSVYVPFGTYWIWGNLSFSYLHHPFFFSTCGTCKLNFDDDDDGLIYKHYSLWYLQTGPFVFFFNFLHKALCIFNIGFFAKRHLPPCSDGPGWLLRRLQRYLPTFFSAKYWELSPIYQLSNVFNV